MLRRVARPALALAVASGLASASAPAATEAPPIPSVAVPTATSWVLEDLTAQRRLVLDATAGLDLLSAFREPARERASDWRAYQRGRFGLPAWEFPLTLRWEAGEPDAEGPEPEAPAWRAPSMAVLDLGPLPSALAVDPVDVLLASPGAASLLGSLPAVPAPRWAGVERGVPCPPGGAPRPVTFVRYGAEHDTFRLLECDGSVAPDALDRLSVIARPPGTPRPALPLPDEPELGAGEREWSPSVRLLHPRLLWALQRVADAFPRRALYVVSGYRPESARSPHARGRALDLQVHGVSPEALLEVCRQLRDVACGYYPNHRFVHLDVRAPGTGHPLWIDASRPGEPSRFVDAWPGVVEGGALTWAGGE